LLPPQLLLALGLGFMFVPLTLTAVSKVRPVAGAPRPQDPTRRFGWL
jgi:hypothetical protein